MNDAATPGAPDSGFVSLFEFLPVGAYRSTLDGRMLRANPALVRINGCTSEAELIARVHDIANEWYVQPLRRAQFKDELAARGRVTGFESEVYRHKTRERIWISENAHVVRDAHGQALYYEGTVEEISERVRERERLVASEGQLARMIDLVPGVVYRLLHYPDGTRRIAFISARVKPLFGVEPEAVKAEPFMLYRLCHPDDLPRLRETVQDVVSGQRSLSAEFRIVLDGRERWIQMSSAPAPSEDGALVRVGIFFDITAHKRAELALRENGELWKNALQSLSDGVWDWDIEHGTGMVSPQGKAMLGYADDELAGDPASMDVITHPDDMPAMRRAREAHFEGRAPVYVNEHRLRCKDGRWKWVLSRGVTMRRDAEGRPLRMIGTHTDIDADRQAEALRHERDRAAAADLAKSHLLSRVSHELRTPLNAILGFAQLLEADAGRADAAAMARYTGHILGSGRHLLALVDDILDLSATQTGELRMALEALPMQPLVDEVIRMFAAAAAAAQVAVQVELPGARPGEPPVALRGDRRRCVQVLSNLLSNAIKYNRAGGWVRLSGRVSSGWVVLSVSDNGPGLSQAQLARLFRPFERVGAERGTVAGTGLGLALSRQLAEAMGGSVAVQSTPGEGSTFSLHLPAA